MDIKGVGPTHFIKVGETNGTSGRKPVLRLAEIAHDVENNMKVNGMPVKSMQFTSASRLLRVGKALKNRKNRKNRILESLFHTNWKKNNARSAIRRSKKPTREYTEYFFSHKDFSKMRSDFRKMPGDLLKIFK